MVDNNHKKCSVCLEDKPLSNFYFRKDSGKYRNECSKCLVEAFNKRRADNPEKIKEISKKTREKNKHKAKKRMQDWKANNPNHRKEYVKNNPEIIKAVAKRAYLKNKDKINEKKKEWYVNNKERHSATRDLYAKNNKERLLYARRKWERNRMDTDINYILQKTLRSRIRGALKSAGGRKAERTENLIGCTVEEFRVFIESQFTDGMSWDNWTTDGWHLDHRIPISWFNLENENCRKLAFSYKNMQPLWWQENFSKNNRYSHKMAI